jgi:hypothetical protein
VIWFFLVLVLRLLPLSDLPQKAGPVNSPSTVSAPSPPVLSEGATTIDPDG